MHLGGSPCNVAVGLARCGARAEFSGKISTDYFGRFLTRALERAGVGTRFLVRAAAPSALAFVVPGRTPPSYMFYGVDPAHTLLQIDELPLAIEGSDVLHFGSISLLTPPTSETVLALAERLRGRTLRSFDPNIRPTLVRETDAYRAVLARALGAADILKLSADDLAWWRPGGSVQQAAAQCVAEGPVLAVVTLGEGGCYARRGAVEFRLPAPPVAVVDTVGAGDAFTSGLLLRLSELGCVSRDALADAPGETIRDALDFATRAATLTCTRAGADPPDRDEIDRFRPASSG
jgi:fructokinase